MSKIIFNKLMGEILGLFASNGNTDLHGRGIARQLKKNQRTVQLCLNELANERILIVQSAGKSRQYRINLENPMAEKCMMMSECSKTIGLLQNFEMAQIVDDIQKSTDEPFLIFGSYAKGYAAKESDLDILIITDKKINAKEIQHKYQLMIHLITLPGKKFEEGIKKRESFQREVITNHIICQGYEYFISQWRRLYGEHSMV